MDDETLDDSYFASHPASSTASLEPDLLEPESSFSSSSSTASTPDSLANASFTDVEARALEFLGVSPPLGAPSPAFGSKTSHGPSLRPHLRDARHAAALRVHSYADFSSVPMPFISELKKLTRDTKVKPLPAFDPVQSDAGMTIAEKIDLRGHIQGLCDAWVTEAPRKTFVPVTARMGLGAYELAMCDFLVLNGNGLKDTPYCVVVKSLDFRVEALRRDGRPSGPFDGFQISVKGDLLIAGPAFIRHRKSHACYGTYFASGFFDHLVKDKGMNFCIDTARPSRTLP
ncbi:hypothetical protein JCM3770_003040 [Rhodotorula araucariae]